jgi:chorismate mutase
MRALVWRALRLPTVRALRGATTVARDDAGAIQEAVSELLAAIRTHNRLEHDEVVSALFTVTPDLVAAFPAEAARLDGWQAIPLLCATEIAVPGALPRCVRVLLHVARPWSEPPRHVYLREAASLRPDLAGGGQAAG